MALAAGSRLGRYQILSLLGAGGMGVVYRAHDERLQRDIALKVLPPSVLFDETARRRFRKEALALAKLSHPNIAAVYDVGEEGDTAYLVMEWVPGEPLSSRRQHGPLPVTEVLSYGIQIAEALEEAHERGVVHRDLKPANVMVTPRGQVKVLDFGLAKLLAPGDEQNATLSRSELGAPAGTPLYMSPEQAFGEAVDGRTDLWSLGVVLYELLAGRAPFEGATDWALLQAVSQQTPPSLTVLRPDLPAGVEALISRAMSRDMAARFASAGAMRTAMQLAMAKMSGDTRPLAAGMLPRIRRWRWAAATAVALVGALALGGWYLVRNAHQRWARLEAPAIITRLMDADLRLGASAVLQRALGYLPGDSVLTNLAAAQRSTIAITTTPARVEVAVQDYLTPDSAWRVLGSTPLSHVELPKGYYRWRLTPPGGKPVIIAPPMHQKMHFALDSMAMAPPGMVRVGADTYGDYIAFIGWVGPYQLPAFDIDRTEVTNAEYQQFVDSGGYRQRKYWTEPFVDGDRTLTWDVATPRFRDRSGRPGPAGWSAGHFPVGEDSLPVAGISWYEAVAYLAFRSKVLPTMAQWSLAGPSALASFVGRVSNMSGTAVAQVGKFRGLGPYGTYDMAGNVREWVSNANETHLRLILGGAWGSAPYLYGEAEALPPFDRSMQNGVRGVRNLGPVPVAAQQPIKIIRRDFARYTPASDAVFKAYTVMYAYDQSPLNAKEDKVVATTADYRVMKVSYDAAYGQQRMSAYLFLPTHVKPPYQAVIFFPSARVLDLHDSNKLGDTTFFDYIVQSGRAVVYPVYQDTYERRLKGALPGAAQELALTTQRSKDVARTIDYLQTRADIRGDDLAYLGVSMGAAEGAIYATMSQDRLRTAVFLDGGFFLEQPTRGGDQADFVPRLKKPVLMVNGRYDATFSLDASQSPMFAMLGTPAADKKHVLLEAAHDVTSERGRLMREVLGWLDKYLGRVE